MSKHTPGPWEVQPGPPATLANNYGRSVLSAPGGTVFWQDRERDLAIIVASYTYSDANARLIAAAPTMEAVLREFVDYYAGEKRLRLGNGFAFQWYERAAAALAEAQPSEPVKALQTKA